MLAVNQFSGHYKRQVVGLGKTERRVIWIEPYWRGPEDAPILVHPLRVGNRPETTPGVVKPRRH